MLIEVLLPSPDPRGEEFNLDSVGKVTRVVEQAGFGESEVRGMFDDDHLTHHALK